MKIPPLPPLDLAALAEAAGGDANLLYWLTQCRFPVNHPVGLANALAFYQGVQGYLDQRREEFEAGRKDALFDAVAWAATNGTPIPEWARAPFSEGWRRYRDVVPDDPAKPSVSTLGGAFGITRPKGFSAPAARFWGEKTSLVWSMVTRRHHAGEKIGPAMFAAVAEELKAQPPNLEVYAMLHGLPQGSAEHLMSESTRNGISAATVSAYYYECLRGIKEHESKRKGQAIQPKTESEKMAHALRGWR